MQVTARTISDPAADWDLTVDLPQCRTIASSTAEAWIDIDLDDPNDTEGWDLVTTILKERASLAHIDVERLRRHGLPWDHTPKMKSIGTAIAVRAYLVRVAGERHEAHAFFRDIRVIAAPDIVITIIFPERGIHDAAATESDRALIAYAAQDAREVLKGVGSDRPFGGVVTMTVMQKIVHAELAAILQLRRIADQLDDELDSVARMKEEGKRRRLDSRKHDEGKTGDPFDARVHHIRRQLRALRWAMIPSDEVDELREDPFETLDTAPIKYRLDDVVHEASRARHSTTELSEQLTQMLAAHEARQNDRLNQALATLTVWATSLLVPTLIAGIYGMNLQIPEARFHLAYPFALLSMAGIGALTFFGVSRRLRR